MITPVTLDAQFEALTEYWSPRVIGCVNDQFVKIAKVKGEFAAPRGVRHRPVAAEECWVLLVETVTTLHTGDVVTPLTRSIAEQLGQGGRDE